MSLKRTCGFIVGTAAILVGVAVLFLVAKALGDLLFPEIPGLSVTHAALVISIAVLTAALLFFEGYRLLFNATADSTEKP